MILANKVILKEVQDSFPWQASRPKWLKEYEVLIKTKRGNKYYITKGLSLEGRWIIKGFDKFKIIGWRDFEK